MAPRKTAKRAGRAKTRRTGAVSQKRGSTSTRTTSRSKTKRRR